MNQYVTGSVIRKLREEKKMTQSDLAEKISVSDKTISKWETGKGYPDISLMEPLAAALGISVMELLSGNEITNQNRSFNMKRIKIYVCPICGNVLVCAGEAVISCCGVSLIPLEVEESDEKHVVKLEEIEDDYYVSMEHDMNKSHYISFFLAVQDDGYTMIKLYPEGSCEARFKRRLTRGLYYYCNKHGLFELKIKRKRGNR